MGVLYALGSRSIISPKSKHQLCECSNELFVSKCDTSPSKEQVVSRKVFVSSSALAQKCGSIC
uniref:Secreted protein n=1 Tax=Heterorhabditis bacteriophora TaxID=37862 RepID=A0A1I7WL53_HETBA